MLACQIVLPFWANWGRLGPFNDLLSGVIRLPQYQLCKLQKRREKRVLGRLFRQMKGQLLLQQQATQYALCTEAGSLHGRYLSINQILSHQIQDLRVPIQNLRELLELDAMPMI